MRRAAAAVRIVAVAVVVVVSVSTLFRGAQRGSDAVRRRVRPQERRAESGALEFYRCLETIVDSAVPRGTRVFVDADDDAAYQRLTEIVTPRAVPVRREADARLVLSFAPASNGCGGTGIAVRTP